jgi:hypothetical protein
MGLHFTFRAPLRSFLQLTNPSGLPPFPTVELDLPMGLVPGGCGRPAPPKEKKPTWWNTLEVFDHVGLLSNEPPGRAGLLFI